MSGENKLYLKRVFNINVCEYNHEQLNDILDRLINYIKDETNRLEEENKKLKQEIFLANEGIEN